MNRVKYTWVGGTLFAAQTSGGVLAVFPVRFFGDPVIKEISIKVIDLGAEINVLAKNMAETMVDAQGIGLAAPQIGVLKQVIVISMQDDGFVTYINPVIVERSGPEEVDDEGCLCLPDVHVPVVRSKYVVVRAQDLKGRTVEIEADDLLARILQHEIDHLAGLTILDRTDKEERRRAIREFLEKQSGD